MQGKPTDEDCAEDVSESVVTTADADPEEERLEALNIRGKRFLLTLF